MTLWITIYNFETRKHPFLSQMQVPKFIIDAP